MINKTSAILALLAASATATECEEAYQCTLYDLEDFDDANGAHTFCLGKNVLGDYADSSAYSFINESFGNFEPTELASYKCGEMVAIDFCATAPLSTTDPNAEYVWSCLSEEETLFSSDGFGDEAASTPDQYDGSVRSIVMKGSKDSPPTLSCRPTIYTNWGCDEGFGSDYDKETLS